MRLQHLSLLALGALALAACQVAGPYTGFGLYMESVKTPPAALEAREQPAPGAVPEGLPKAEFNAALIQPPGRIEVQPRATGGGGSAGGGFAAAPAKQGNSLTVRVDAARLLERRVLSTVNDIEYVTILVQPQGFAEVSQSLTRAEIAGGFGFVTFPDLPAVTCTVRISAFDVNGKLIGSGTQQTTVVAGSDTQVSFAVPLDPTYIQATGGISTDITFQDGPEIVGTPPPGPHTASGTLLQALKIDNGPEAIAFDPQGNVWIAAYNGDKLYRYNVAGQALGTTTLAPLPPAAHAKPSAIVFDQTGIAWVTNYEGGSLASFDPTGSLIAQVPIGAYPAAAAFDPQGKLWVVNHFGNNITVVNNGRPAGQFKTSARPIAIAFDPTGNAFVACLQAKVINKLSPLGATTASYATGLEPEGVALDGAGNLWVTNNASDNVMKFDGTGALKGTFPTGRGPRGIAFDKQGYVWIANDADGTVTKLNSLGVKQGTYRSGRGARNVAVDRGGNIWVTNFDAGTVVKLAP